MCTQPKYRPGCSRNTRNRCAVSARRFAVMTLPGAVGVLALLVAASTPFVLAQVRPLTPPTPVKGDDQTGAFLPAGVESADQATERVRSHKPDPGKYPVARTPWDGKPD